MPSRPPIILPVAEYMPDMPDYMGRGSSNVLNVIPRTPRSYGPLNSPAPFSAALPARCQGAYFGLDGSGNVNGFAGTASNLYQLTSASSAWSNVSKSANTYNLASEDQWRFCLYGVRVIATDYADAVQSFVLGSSTTFADLITTSNPPKARFATPVKSFLMLGDTTDPVYGAQHQRVWWSANGDPTNFPTPGSQSAAQFESGYQDLLGDGGWVKGIVGNVGSADVLVIMEHQIWRGEYAGNGIFNFYGMEGVRGTPASGSVAQLGGQVFYLGEDGFYMTDGATSIPIGANKVDKTFYADLDTNYFGSISSAIDPVNKLYIVYYPGAGHSGAACNKMLMYNWQLGRWSAATPIGGVGALGPGGGVEISKLGGSGGSTGGEYIVRALSFGYTLDQIYTILGYTLDTMPYNLDSRVWTGGNLLLGIFDSNHTLNFFTGTPLNGSLDTNEIQPSPGQVTRVTNTRPIVDGTIVPFVSIGTRNRQVDTPAFSNAIGMSALGTCPQRVVGRYVRARLSLPSSSSWTNITGVELEGAPAGVRY